MHGGTTTTGPDATHLPTIFQNLGGGGSWGGGLAGDPGEGGAVPAGGRGGGVFLPGVGGGVWPGVMGASNHG